MTRSQPLFGVAFSLPEVTLKVHISDASTHQPVPDALIEIFTSQVSLASGTSGTDGVAFIRFQYKLGSQLIVTASKHAYVPNSAPWKPIRLPGTVLSAFLSELMVVPVTESDTEMSLSGPQTVRKIFA